MSSSPPPPSPTYSQYTTSQLLRQQETLRQRREILEREGSKPAVMRFGSLPPSRSQSQSPLPQPSTEGPPTRVCRSTHSHSAPPPSSSRSQQAQPIRGRNGRLNTSNTSSARGESSTMAVKPMHFSLSYRPSPVPLTSRSSHTSSSRSPPPTQVLKASHPRPTSHERSGAASRTHTSRQCPSSSTPTPSEAQDSNLNTEEPTTRTSSELEHSHPRLHHMDPHGSRASEDEEVSATPTPLPPPRVSEFPLPRYSCSIAFSNATPSLPREEGSSPPEHTRPATCLSQKHSPAQAENEEDKDHQTQQDVVDAAPSCAIPHKIHEDDHAEPQEERFAVAARPTPSPEPNMEQLDVSGERRSGHQPAPSRDDERHDGDDDDAASPAPTMSHVVSSFDVSEQRTGCRPAVSRHDQPPTTKDALPRGATSPYPTMDDVVASFDVAADAKKRAVHQPAVSRDDAQGAEPPATASAASPSPTMDDVVASFDVASEATKRTAHQPALSREEESVDVARCASPSPTSGHLSTSARAAQFTGLGGRSCPPSRSSSKRDGECALDQDDDDNDDDAVEMCCRSASANGTLNENSPARQRVRHEPPQQQDDALTEAPSPRTGPPHLVGVANTSEDDAHLPAAFLQLQEEVLAICEGRVRSDGPTPSNNNRDDADEPQPRATYTKAPLPPASASASAHPRESFDLLHAHSDGNKDGCSPSIQSPHMAMGCGPCMSSSPPPLPHIRTPTPPPRRAKTVDEATDTNDLTSHEPSQQQQQQLLLHRSTSPLPRPVTLSSRVNRRLDPRRGYTSTSYTPPPTTTTALHSTPQTQLPMLHASSRGMPPPSRSVPISLSPQEGRSTPYPRGSLILSRGRNSADERELQLVSEDDDDASHTITISAQGNVVVYASHSSPRSMEEEEHAGDDHRDLSSTHVLERTQLDLIVSVERNVSTAHISPNDLVAMDSAEDFHVSVVERLSQHFSTSIDGADVRGFLESLPDEVLREVDAMNEHRPIAEQVLMEAAEAAGMAVPRISMDAEVSEDVDVDVMDEEDHTPHRQRMRYDYASFLEYLNGVGQGCAEEMHESNTHQDDADGAPVPTDAESIHAEEEEKADNIFTSVVAEMPTTPSHGQQRPTTLSEDPVALSPMTPPTLKESEHTLPVQLSPLTDEEEVSVPDMNTSTVKTNSKKALAKKAKLHHRTANATNVVVVMAQKVGAPHNQNRPPPQQHKQNHKKKMKRKTK